MTSTANRELFVRMLTALGRKHYDAFQGDLDPEIVCEWPYRVLEGFPTRMVGAQRLREALEMSLKTFAPYNYRIQEIYDLAQDDRLVAEYSSHSTYLPRKVPYSNQYVGILEFRNGKVTRWREYVNPLLVLEALGPGFRWEEGRGAREKPQPSG